jgi:hypothetical protein
MLSGISIREKGEKAREKKSQQMKRIKQMKKQ